MSSLVEAMNRFQDMPDVLYVYRFPRWKHPVVRQCFPGQRLVFLEKAASVPVGAWLVLWGMNSPPTDLAADVKVLRMEDGFLRSIGLGADLVKPLSWVVDGRGIHYDATQSSDLEACCADTVFDQSLLARAACLRATLVATGLTKYNVGVGVWQRPSGVARVILVPGQVESDASLAYGAPFERSNLGLLRRVRIANPDAYLIYKPHPDVVAGLRASGQNEQEAYQWCDEVLIDANMGDLLMMVDEVHVLTSLSGFEALLRGKAVTCYGQPFYAGWGLTHDIVPNPRRSRRLSLDELVAAALIKYPLYLSRNGKKLITAEEALDEMWYWRAETAGRPAWPQEFIRFFLRRIIGVR